MSHGRRFEAPDSESLHLWRIPLASAPEAADSILSEDERARARRFLPMDKKLQFIAARCALRGILAAYLDISPAAVAFACGREGKPALAPQLLAKLPLHFNISHTRGLAVLALARGRPVGVDVEALDAARPMMALARRFFSPAEAGALSALSGPALAAGFYRCWTAKEAYVKALGKGLHLPLGSFSVEVDPRLPLRLLSSDRQDESQWQFLSLDAGEGYAASAVVKTPPVCVQLHQFAWG